MFTSLLPSAKFISFTKCFKSLSLLKKLKNLYVIETQEVRKINIYAKDSSASYCALIFIKTENANIVLQLKRV